MSFIIDVVICVDWPLCYIEADKKDDEVIELPEEVNNKKSLFLSRALELVGGGQLGQLLHKLLTKGAMPPQLFQTYFESLGSFRNASIILPL